MATVALFFATTGLIVALAAQAVGYDRGFSQTTFRAVQIGAQLIAPLALTWALAELTGKSLGSRFTARLGLGALTVVGAVVLATDPLSSASFSKNWPPASVHYQLIPNWVLEAVAVVAAVFAVVAVIVAGVRGRRNPGWRGLFLAVAAIAAAAVATDWLRATFSANTAYPVICLAAAALAWFGAVRTRAVQLERLRSGGYSWDEDTGSFVQYHDDSGEFAYNDTGGFGRDRAATDSRGWYADEPGGPRPDPADTDFNGWFRPGADTGGFHHDPRDSGGYDRGPDSGSFPRSDTGGFGPHPSDPPGLGPHPADSGSFGPHPSDPPGPGPHPADSGGFGPHPSDPRGFHRDAVDNGGLPQQAADAYAGYGVVPPEPGPPNRGQNGTMGSNPNPSYVETGDVLP